MCRPIKKGSTDKSIVIRIIDSTAGTPEEGVEYDTSGIALWYRREGAAKVAITPAALAALTTAHSDGGIEHIDDGYYRLDSPDAAFASGVDGVMFGGTVTGMIVIGCYVPLVDYDPYDSVRMGLTALPNAEADASGGLPISDAGGLDLDSKLANTNEITVARMGALTDWINGGRLDLLIDAIKAKTDNLPADPADDSDIDSQLSTIDGKLDTIDNFIDTEIAAIKSVTDNLPDSGALTALIAYVDTIETTLANATYGLANLKTLIDTIDNFVDTEIAAIKAVTDKVDDTLEDDGGTYRFTTNALEQAPSGGGGGDATEANQTTIINTLSSISGATFDSGTDSLEAISNTIGSVGGVAGAGSETWVYTLTDADSGNPIADADVWVTSDEAGTNVIASGTTDQNGQVTFYLDTGTVYIFRQKSGWDFVNPDTETVA